MPRRTIAVCALNVIIHDENRRDYEQLFRDALELQTTIQFDKTHAASFMTLSDALVYSEYRFFDGMAYRFVNVSPPYFNTEDRMVILDQDGNPKDLLNENTKSNTKEFRFAIMEDMHRIFVDTKNISPLMAQKFFTQLLETDTLLEKYGDINVIVQSDRRAIEDILEIPVLKSLRINISRPNPIGLNRYDEEVLGEMEEQNSEQLIHELKSGNDAIQPNDKTKRYMYTATTHGTVIGRGKNSEGLPVEKSTQEIPVKKAIRRREHENFRTLLLRASKELWEKIRRQGHE